MSSIARSTAFVIGAGASADYGFPSAEELRDEIVSSEKHRDELLELTAFRKAPIDDFRHRLSRGARSVDRFLEHNLEFLDLGKAAISNILARRENDSTLWEPRPSNWIKFLFDKMSKCPLQDFGQNTASFITFNYDRSLEHYLFEAIRELYGASQLDRLTQLSKIPIVHVHGRLGFLPWQDAGGGAYSPEMSVRAMEICTRGIQMAKSTEGERDYAAARRLLAQAEQIYFLGFGYDDENLNRLGFAVGEDKKKNVKGTGRGLSNKECNDLGRKYKIFPQEGLGCLELLRNHVEWD
jgi:hypothetical protein